LACNISGFFPDHRYLIEDVKEALKKPGEWYLDRCTDPPGCTNSDGTWTLTYLAKPGENPNKQSVIVPQLPQLLAAEGLEVLWVDCSPPGTPVRVVKTIVPGLESETMSYHRIGWRSVRRLRARPHPLVLDAPRSGAARVPLRTDDEHRRGAPASFDAALVDRRVHRPHPPFTQPCPLSAPLRLLLQPLQLPHFHPTK